MNNQITEALEKHILLIRKELENLLPKITILEEEVMGLKKWRDQTDEKLDKIMDALDYLVEERQSDERESSASNNDIRNLNLRVTHLEQVGRRQ